METLDPFSVDKRPLDSCWQLVLFICRHSVLTLQQGHTGDVLSFSKDAEDLKTYFTRDAGWTWYEIRNGSHIYEFADHGALILMADNLHPTKTILYLFWLTFGFLISFGRYTWNQGINITACDFTTDSAVEIRDIIVEPSFKPETFIIHGTRKNGTDNVKGVVIHVDFNTAAKPAECETFVIVQRTDFVGRQQSDRL